MSKMLAGVPEGETVRNRAPGQCCPSSLSRGDLRKMRYNEFLKKEIANANLLAVCLDVTAG